MTEVPTVIVEGGMVRDVIGAPDFYVIDLDTLDDADAQEVRELLNHAEGLLPDDYSERAAIIKDITERLDWLESH